jgi:hypothetical protein
MARDYLAPPDRVLRGGPAFTNVPRARMGSWIRLVRRAAANGDETAHLRQSSGMATLDGLAHRNFVLLKPERSVEVARDVVAGSDMKGDAS